MTEDAYDALIVNGQLSDSTLIARCLAPDVQQIVASPAYISRYGEPRSPKDLEERDCLLHGNSRSWVFRQHGREETVRVSGRIQSDDTDLLRWTALAGTGILRASMLNVAHDVLKGRLVVLLPDYEVVSKSAIWIVHSNSRHMLPRLRALLDHMANWSRDHLMPEGVAKSEQFATK
jgi:DNA-binding transcriptional LysR family regulator